ncbi:MAG: class I SAM-dependent methyltransferase [Burkholderiales bacterium]|nr:class I SAM-dependent methyltransferase [Burkholderiales bacterium]
MGPSNDRSPNRRAALDRYRQRAAIYDWELAAFEPLRRAAVERLQLAPGDRVLDLGCGTGLSLAALHAGSGDAGQVVGVEQCPEMIEIAHERVRCGHWRGVRLICAPVEAAELAGPADAALFHFTHDILQCAAALDNVLRHLRPGARIVATGLKWAPPGPLWALVNGFVLPAALYSVTSLASLDRPWALLEQRLGPMAVEDSLCGGGFIASAEYRP